MFEDVPDKSESKKNMKPATTPVEGVKDAEPVAVELAPSAKQSTWTAALVTALFSGLTGLIVAAGGMFVTINSIRKENTKQVEEVKAQVEQVHELVNASDSARLEKIARLARRIATITGKKEDIIEAEAAEHNVEEKVKATQTSTRNKNEADKAAAEKE